MPFPGVGGRIGYGDMDRSRYANTINILDVKTLHCNQYTSCGSRIANNIPNGDVLIILIRSKLIRMNLQKVNIYMYLCKVKIAKIV